MATASKPAQRSKFCRHAMSERPGRLRFDGYLLYLLVAVELMTAGWVFYDGLLELMANLQ